jgi:hypothetical protein
MISLLYVSRAALSPGEEEGQLAQIVATARRRNLELGITGALSLLGDRFAQWLEGPEAQVNQLMIAILRDPRHRDVRIIEISPAATRRFPSWSMAFVPPSSDLRARLDRLADPSGGPDEPGTAESLVEQMVRGASSSVPLG